MIESDNPNAAKLPEPARARYLELRQQAQDLASAHHMIFAELSNMRLEKLNAEGTLASLRARGFREESLTEVHERIAKAAAEVQRLNEIHTARTDRWRPVAELNAAIEIYLDELHVENIEAYDGSPPKAVAVTALADTVERCRRRVRELRADLRSVLAAPIPSAQAKKIAAQRIEEIAERARPDCFGLIEGATTEIGWPTQSRRALVLNPGEGERSLSVSESIDPLALNVWLRKAEIISALNAEIDAAADDSNALDDNTRAKKERTIMNDLLAVQRDEEFYVESAHQAGLEIARRSDCDPRAVLGLAGTLPAPENQ